MENSKMKIGKGKMINRKGEILAGLVMLGLYCAGQLVSPSKIDAYPYAYVANAGSNTVSVINIATNQVVSSPVPVGSNPNGIAITPDGRYIYVANTGSGNVSVIDTVINSIICNIPLQISSNPIGIAITPDGRYTYVSNSGSNNVSVIDTNTNLIVGTISVGLNPSGVAMVPDGKYVYVTNGGSDSVSVINTSTNEIVGSPISVLDGPSGIGITPDGRYAYVVNWAINFHSFDRPSFVSVIDTTTKLVIKNIEVGCQPHGIAITPDGKYAYVNSPISNDVSVIDIAKNQVIVTISVGSGPYEVSITPDGKYAYVTNQGSDNVSVIDTATNQVIVTIPVGSIPRGVAIATILPTLSNTQITNGSDTGISNEPDTPGDVLLIYTSTMGNGTITCNQVTTTVEQVYGLSVPQPADKSGTYGTTIYYTYWIGNTGNGTDTIHLTSGSSWVSTIIQDDNQDGVWQATETTTITQLILTPNQFNYFFLAVQIPATATTGQQSTTTLTAKDQNGAGTDDSWGDPDTRTDEVITLCSVGMPAVITITKTRDKGQVKPGGTITYTLTYRNNTGSPATDITIIDAVPANTTLAEPATGTDTTVEYYVSGAWTTTFSTTATKVKWIRTTPLSAVSEATVRFTVQVK